MMRRLRTEERGTSLVIVALSLVVLLGFAAVAVDGAGAWAQRRQDQSAADTGAVAGAIFMRGKDKATAIADATDEVIRITYNTLEPDMSFADWTLEWTSCTDPTKPPSFTETGVSDCVSFTSNLQKIRVNTPIIPWETTFANVLGFSQVDTRAEAEVRVALDVPGGVLPFGMPASSAGGEVCLKTGANPHGLAPCDGPDQGNFGFLDFTQFGNDDLGTTKTCSGGGTDRLERNIAEGIDHALGIWEADPVDPNLPKTPIDPNHEVTACNDGNFSAFPHQVDAQTGNVAQALDDGFADGVDGLDGKLARGTNKINVRGQLLDNTTLRSFLTGPGKTYCDGVVADGDTDTHTEMAQCLSSWTTGDPVLFNTSLAEAPRLGWVPRLWEDFGPGTTTLTIRDIAPIYIQATLWGCNASSCSLIWNPGEAPTPGPNNVRIEASTALVIPKGALPQAIRDDAPGSETQIEYLLSK